MMEHLDDIFLGLLAVFFAGVFIRDIWNGYWDGDEK